ncbi:MAG TPA: sensor domain-containing protein, partial [Streptomyces sp.]|nr:sensor domain-containing protein [Streptomyces sp.]
MTASAHPDNGLHPAEEPLPPPRPVALDTQTWREIAHLLTNLPVGMVGFLYISVCIYLSALLSVTVVGLPLLAISLLGCRRLGRFE